MDQKSPEAFRTISEVADWLGVPTHVLRFWESRFAQVKPVKRAGGRRYYRPSDMELLGGIRKLLHEDGMTIRGVQKLLREQGVKYVAEMSPSLETSADTRDVTPDNVVDLSDRRGGREAGSEVEDAEIVEAAPRDDEAGDQGRRFPFDDEPAPVVEDAGRESEPESAVAEPEELTEGADAPAPDMPDEIAAEGADSAEPLPEADSPVEADPAAPEPADGAVQDTLPEPPAPNEHAAADDTAPADIADPLPEPEAMDFLAHGATPETYEVASGKTDAPADSAEAEPLETDPSDPMSSPQALDFAAHDAEPELAEGNGVEPMKAEAEEQDAEEPAAPGVEGTDTHDAAIARPALAMPDIGPDPEDDAIDVDPPFSVRLRHARAARAALPAASLHALADRLDELARRSASDADGHRGM
jgi:DNA-binding transcriptional MerR regulator